MPVKEILFGYTEEVVCNGDDLMLNPLFNFEPMEGGRCENVWECE